MPALAKIEKTFGSEYLQADGTLDRAKLGDLIFGDAQARRKLNTITHPGRGNAAALSFCCYCRWCVRRAAADTARLHWSLLKPCKGLEEQQRLTHSHSLRPQRS